MRSKALIIGVAPHSYPYKGVWVPTDGVTWGCRCETIPNAEVNGQISIQVKAGTDIVTVPFSEVDKLEGDRMRAVVHEKVNGAEYITVVLEE